MDVMESLHESIEELCHCGFTLLHLMAGEFRCLSHLEEVTYRARLSGTTSTSSSDIIALIEEWVVSGDASVLVLLVRMSLDSTCRPVAIEWFDAHECGEGDPPPASDKSDNSAAVVGGVVAVVVVLIIAIAVVALVIAVLVLRRRRHGELSLRDRARSVVYYCMCIPVDPHFLI